MIGDLKDIDWCYKLCFNNVFYGLGPLHSVISFGHKMPTLEGKIVIVFGIGTNFDWDCIRRIQQFGRISGFIAVTVFLVCIGGQDVANACDQQDQGQ